MVMVHGGRGVHVCIVMGHGGRGGGHVWSWVMEVGVDMCGHGSWR